MEEGGKEQWKQEVKNNGSRRSRTMEAGGKELWKQEVKNYGSRR